MPREGSLGSKGLDDSAIEPEPIIDVATALYLHETGRKESTIAAEGLAYLSRRLGGRSRHDCDQRTHGRAHDLIEEWLERILATGQREAEGMTIHVGEAQRIRKYPQVSAHGRLNRSRDAQGASFASNDGSKPTSEISCGQPAHRGRSPIGLHKSDEKILIAQVARA